MAFSCGSGLGDGSAALPEGRFAGASRHRVAWLQGDCVSLGTTTSVSPKPRLAWRGFVALLGLFAGLCTIFALIVTVAEGWQEHSQAQWPEATAHIEKCYLHQSSTGAAAPRWESHRRSPATEGSLQASFCDARSLRTPKSDVPVASWRRN